MDNGTKDFVWSGYLCVPPTPVSLLPPCHWCSSGVSNWVIREGPRSRQQLSLSTLFHVYCPSCLSLLVSMDLFKPTVTHILSFSFLPSFLAGSLLPFSITGQDCNIIQRGLHGTAVILRSGFTALSCFTVIFMY